MQIPMPFIPSKQQLRIPSRRNQAKEVGKEMVIKKNAYNNFFNRGIGKNEKKII